MQRMTRQRAAVSGALEDLADFRSAQQLHDILRTRGDNVGLATVYRTLQSLADGGDVDVLRTDEGENLYRRCERREHHHHTRSRTVEIDGPTVEAWANRVGTSHGFVDIQHTIELFGTCADCARASSARD